jgi:hypothetical protein
MLCLIEWFAFVVFLGLIRVKNPEGLDLELPDSMSNIHGREDQLPDDKGEWTMGVVVVHFSIVSHAECYHAWYVD